MSDVVNNSIQREYVCNNQDCCDGEVFIVIHSNETERNTRCWWCREPVKETGVTWKVEGDNVVVRKNEEVIETFRRKSLSKT